MNGTHPFPFSTEFASRQWRSIQGTIARVMRTLEAADRLTGPWVGALRSVLLARWAIGIEAQFLECLANATGFGRLLGFVERDRPFKRFETFGNVTAL